VTGISLVLPERFLATFSPFATFTTMVD